ncbi:MAG: MutL protein [Rhodospirillales bacterium]|nr:MutL protein [Rhodospirillales bacterium]MSP80581.1 MutL protein [Rhodospirillales bacterium]
MTAALLIDFGSTYTKLRAVDLDRPALLAAGQGPSTVTTDVTIGMKAALADLEHKLGKLPVFKYRLASSSAAGGLKMVTIGLVRELTAEAARQAALGAGAKLVGAFAYRLTPADEKHVVSLAPDIILLAGGTDGGNVDVIRHNAQRLAGLGLDCPVVLAGNRDVGEEIAGLLGARGKIVHLAENVMPNFGELNIDPARAAIRRVFIDRIVHAKGIDRAASSFDAVLMPTPAAVMEGARLLADGIGNRKGLGDLLVVDIGGATTDVHSVAHGNPVREGVIQHGLPEPRVKRTVEGDLGMRHNAATIVAAIGHTRIAQRSGVSDATIERILAAFTADVERLPESPEEIAFDEALAWAAVRIAVERHSGTAKTVQTAQGPVVVQIGKDLTALGTVIGTGGPLAHGATPATVLEAARADPAQPLSLRPAAPRLLVDGDYMLYAAGLLAAVEPDAALALALGSLRPVGTKRSHEQTYQAS